MFAFHPTVPSPQITRAKDSKINKPHLQRRLWTLMIFKNSCKMPEGAELQALDSSPVATPSHTRCHTRNVTPVTLRFDLEAVAQEFRNMGHDAPSSGLSDSPTQTPLHTRTGSKKGMIVRPHTVKEAGKFMADLEALVPGDRTCFLCLPQDMI